MRRASEALFSFEELTRIWSEPEAGEAVAALAATRAALAEVSPADLVRVDPLISALGMATRRPAVRPAAREALFALLEAVRPRSFRQRLEPAQIEGWTRLVVRALEDSDYTVHQLLRAREAADPDSIALETRVPEPARLTVAEVGRWTRAIARGLLALLKGERPGRVALLGENSLELALCDLACLSQGIFDAPIPANSVGQQVEEILRHCRANVLIVSNEEQAAKVLPARSRLPELRSVVMLSPSAARRHGFLSLEQLAELGESIPDEERAARAAGVRSRDLATVMYTSGTTGTPKGISFSQLNLVSKRFCRGFAVPLLGEGDVFLSYLPLFHTFGRWLELLGSLFWGATYSFARSPARHALLEDFARVRPTAFLSVPKKWMELHEEAQRAAAPEGPDAAALALRRLTGGRLRFGLSAAGYLDPAVFHAFRRAGIELCSGYGMTECTGGATMTPLGEYVEGSIGKPLPGIELRVAPDGELAMRGPYVMPGYLDPPDGDTGLDADGWFATGDLVAVDPDGHFRITGRKKEIYKNRNGQTIAPARVENLFKELDAVGQAFVVGDHRDYNALLVWPNYEGQPRLRELEPEQLRALLGSLVASVNRFLAPYERVVAFQLLDRPLSEEHGELTPKGTFRREAVERNWAKLIEPMYEQTWSTFPVGRFEVRVPHWVLREAGAMREDLGFESGRLLLQGRGMPLAEEPGAGGEVRVGDFRYRPRSRALDLGALLGSPASWLGNEALVALLGEEAFAAFASRRGTPAPDMLPDTRLAPLLARERVAEFAARIRSEELTPASLHAAAALLREGGEEGRQAVAHLERGLALGRSETARTCRALLRRGAEAPEADVRAAAFEALLPNEDLKELPTTLRRLACAEPPILPRLAAAGAPESGGGLIAALGARGLSERRLGVLRGELERWVASPADLPRGACERLAAAAALGILASCAVRHPSGYAGLRFLMARLSLSPDRELSARASEELDRMQLGFRSWLGPNLRLAADPSSGEPYGWAEAVEFAEDVPPAHRELLLRALTDTPLVREAAFLFRGGLLVSLADLGPGSVKIRRLGGLGAKAVYRMEVLTRAGDGLDVKLNLAEQLPVGELREEIRWIQTASAPPQLCGSFGGYWPEHGLFTEEYVPGETVQRQFERMTALGAAARLRSLWPFHVWSALSAHVAFWERTGFRLALADPSPSGVVVPSHDYQAGSRLVSLSRRVPCESGEALLQRFKRLFVEPVERDHPGLAGGAPPALLLSAFVEVLGVDRAEAALAGTSARDLPVDAFFANVRRKGFTPRRLHFARERYQRWLRVNPGATLEARGAMLQELWGTYRLEELERRWPDVRLKFFDETVFRGAREELATALDGLMVQARQGTLGPLAEAVAGLRAGLRTTPEEDYFLARLTWRYLAPTDQASLVSLPSGDRRVAEVAIHLTGADGLRFAVRAPISPREVARLLALFHESSLPVVFGAEHEYLVAVDEKGVVLGGLHFRVTGERARMEKVVVARAWRGRGVADGLMHEFIRRLKARGLKGVETGFFLRRYFTRFGFRVEPNAGGLLRDLESEGGPPWARI